MPRRGGLFAALAALAAALSACGATNDDALRSSLTALRTPPATPSSSPAPRVNCAHPDWSLRPAGPGPSVEAIRRGALELGFPLPPIREPEAA